MKNYLSLLLFLVGTTLSVQARCALIDFVYSHVGHEVQVDIDGDPHIGPYFYIRIPEELGTGSEIYLYDRIPGSFDIDDLVRFEAIAQGRIPNGRPPLNRLRQNTAGFYLFYTPREVALEFPDLGLLYLVSVSLRVPLHREIIKGKVKIREYRVKLKDLFHVDSDFREFLEGNLSLEFQLYLRGAKHAFEAGYGLRAFNVDHLADLTDCIDALIGNHEGKAGPSD